MIECAICNEPSEGRICGKCDDKRLAAASYERILSGHGLNYRNTERYSVENWIKANQKEDDSE